MKTNQEIGIPNMLVIACNLKAIKNEDQPRYRQQSSSFLEESK